ncbi:hypothetical protein N0V85_008899 [Neurospora sp. IMI 360204]|nr:hypothetical protein N0V85_008899 [Neurospora sp. IMI 360204]
MSQTHSTQRHSQDGGDYMRPGDGIDVVAEQFQGYLTGAVGHVQSPATVFQANWSFSAQQGDGLSYGQYSSGPGEGSSAVSGGFFPDFVDNRQFELDNLDTNHAGGSTCGIPSQAGRPGPSTPSVLFSPFPLGTPQPRNQLIAPSPPDQPQSNCQPTPPVGRPPAAVYPHRRRPKMTSHEWSSEQDTLLWGRKTGSDPKRKTSPAIAEELFHTFNVTVTPNVVTKRWAKLKKQRINNNLNELTPALNEVASRTAALFQDQLRLVGNVDTQSVNGQMGIAARNVIQELQTKIARNLQDAAIALQNATMSESD